MKCPKVRYVFDRYGVADDYKSSSKKKHGLVQVELYFEGKRTFFSSGIKVYKGQWDKDRYVINHLESSALNMRLNNLMLRMHENILGQTSSGKFSVSEFARLFDYSDPNAYTIADAFSDYMELIKESKTYKSYETVISNIDSYNLDHDIRYKSMSVLSEIDYDTIVCFDTWMRSRGLMPGTIGLYHSKIKHVISESIKRGRVAMSNPYERFKIKSDRRDVVKYLNEAELKKLDEYIPKNDSYEFAKDVWIFMRYTGVSFSDASSIDISTDVEVRDGKSYLVRSRQKTGVNYTILILKPAMDILNKYNGHLDKFKLAYVDKMLGEIGKEIIGKKITTKMARHTYAVWALHNKVSLPVVSKMLGHTKIETTQIYARVLAQDVIDEFSKLENALSSENSKVKPEADKKDDDK